MEEMYPLYPNAIILPILALPACLLGILPMSWHFSQNNIAAGSLMLWLNTLNFFNAINALIWSRDNVPEWYDGNVLCDIEARIQVGAVVALAACTAVVARKLAKVMDTNNITVAPSKRSRIIEKTLEIVWCWAYPTLLMVLYYIVQPARYFIFGISGCVAAYDTSWPSIVVIWIWGPITTLVTSYYAGLLIFRLHRYRREFHRLIAARNTTKSRFLRLFLLSIIFIIVFLPYSLYIVYALASTIDVDFDWAKVHGPNWNTVVKVPVQGQVRFDKWGQIASGYLLFFLFGTGTEAHNSYKRMLCALGLGKPFPSLYIMRESGSSTPASVSSARGWASNWSSKAKSFFSSKSGSVSETLPYSTQHGSVVMGTPTTNRSINLEAIPTNEPMLTQNTDTAQIDKSFFSRLLGRRSRQHPTLPVSAGNSIDQMATLDISPSTLIPPGVYAHAWASADPITSRTSDDGVQVVREVHQAHQGKGKQKEIDTNAWA